MVLKICSFCQFAQYANCAPQFENFKLGNLIENCASTPRFRTGQACLEIFENSVSHGEAALSQWKFEYRCMHASLLHYLCVVITLSFINFCFCLWLCSCWKVPSVDAGNVSFKVFDSVQVRISLNDDDLQHQKLKLDLISPQVGYWVSLMNLLCSAVLSTLLHVAVGCPLCLKVHLCPSVLAWVTNLEPDMMCV